jgi:hypothetical protein
MSRTERIREPISSLPDAGELARRAADGWRPVAVEWERSVAPGQPVAVLQSAEIPYGLRVGESGDSLEQHPEEVEAMMVALDGIVQDLALSEVAAELGRQGHSMRNGSPWTQTAVFQLLPRLVEVAPAIYASAEWAARRQRRRQPALRVVHE